MKNKETFHNWSQPKSKNCGLRILSIYVRPFRIMYHLMFVCGFSWCEVLQTLRQTPSKTCVMYTRGACMYCENSTWILDKHTACVYYDHNTCLHFAATTNTPISNFSSFCQNWHPYHSFTTLAVILLTPIMFLTTHQSRASKTETQTQYFQNIDKK